ncbi:MAG: inner membrane-spanning protein YciB [Alphaproteobacteria bacterium]
MIFEYLPLIVFGLGYYFYDIVTATIALVMASLFVLPIIWKKTGKIPYTHIFTALLLSFFGGLTVFSGDTSFIKMKPTIASLIFAGILFSVNFTNFNALKKVFASSVLMNDEAWKKLCNNTVIYFLLCAVANEIVWRNFTETQWVQFKIFGLTGLNILFMFVHIPFFKKNAKLKQ